MTGEYRNRSQIEEKFISVRDSQDFQQFSLSQCLQGLSPFSSLPVSFCLFPVSAATLMALFLVPPDSSSPSETLQPPGHELFTSRLQHSALLTWLPHRLLAFPFRSGALQDLTIERFKASTEAKPEEEKLHARAVKCAGLGWRCERAVIAH